MELLSDSFELRFFSNDKSANGETDFKGETSTLTTGQRVEFLNAYADRMSRQYQDFSLEQPVVSLQEAQERLKQVKPQPLPGKRKRILLDEWKWIGYGEKKSSRLSRIEAGKIVIPEQNWRCMMEMELSDSDTLEGEAFSFGGAAVFGFDEEGGCYYVRDGEKVSISDKLSRKTGAKISRIKIELDFVYKKWNLWLEDCLCGDFADFSDKEAESASVFTVAGRDIREVFRHVWGVGYYPRKDNKFEPFTIETFIDESFDTAVSMENWMQLDYNEQKWQSGCLPIAYGGERYAGQDLYLRKRIFAGSLPAYAELYMESLIPGGEVYLNGRLVCQISDSIYHKIDVTDYLIEGDNILAVRVYADKIKDSNKMTHTHTDLYTGWSAGRMYLDFLPEIYIEDVFSWTAKLEPQRAVQEIEVSVRSCRGVASVKTVDHEVAVSVRPWYPQEGEICSRNEWRTAVNPNMSELSRGKIVVEKPRKWSCQDPNLYEICVELKNANGEVVDDYVITTGIRLVSQDGGIFRINGKPELLRAPLLFGARPPFDKIAAWEKCPPAEFYVQEMLMVQGMNGNGLRMSVHDEKTGGINDPRICELADQLGIMLVWQTTAWLRITSAYNLDYTELTQCIRQVRNHPSIVIWQPMNHPSWKNWDMIMRVYRMMYDAISSVDQSRLISPAADSRRMRPRWDDGLTDFEGRSCDSCDPIWTADRICRGNMDYILGYGNAWSALRQWPYVEAKNLPDYMNSTAYIPSYLESKERAYFNFEHDEIIGQPNWDLYKGKPMYHVMSYEDYYDEGSIGRSLSFEEWKSSQAWQALGAYETICKCRWLDYDGLCWCNLRGGQNTATYQKSLVDYYGQAKIAYYAHRMAFQDVLACSGNVDMVYGPDDKMPVMILNLGEAKKVRLEIEIESTDGQSLCRKVFSDISIPEGRTLVRIEEVMLPKLVDGIYSIHYRIYG
ncbi:MAG: hypothetical protein K2N80_16470 [Lachnospiraceae bacterium]|nr:hypothetical protein [Lachnospiraceae bacterium]